MTDSEVPEPVTGSLRCLRCRSLNLVRSGREPYRFECQDCKQHYFVVMQLVPVDPDYPTPLLESSRAEQSQGPG